MLELCNLQFVTCSYRLQVELVATFVGMVMWQRCCVITATLYVYSVDQCRAIPTSF